MDKYDKIVQDYNNNDVEDILEILGGNTQALFKILDKKGKLDDLDYETPLQNELFFYLSQNHPEKFREISTDILVDVEINSKGELIFIASDFEDLTKFFCQGRDSLSQRTIEAILSGEDDDLWDLFSDTTDDLYRDVIEDLTPENLQLLIMRLSKESPLIKPTTSLLETLASGQDNNGLVKIDEENLDEILDDEENAEAVLKQNVDIKSDLYSIHHSAYNSAYHSEVSINVMDALYEIFDGPLEVKQGFGNKKFYIEIKLNKEVFLNTLKSFLEANRQYQNETLERYGYFSDIYNEVSECVDAFAPDYADWTKTKENINLIFPDYF
jgi:hypothetical protein